ADPKTRLADVRGGPGNDRPHPTAALAAEGAAALGAGRRAFQAGTRHAAHCALGGFDTRFADEDVRSGNQLGDLALRTIAPGAHEISCHVARPPDAGPPAAAGALDDLLDPLMAQRERIGDLAQRAARKVQPPDGGVIIGP